MGGWSDERLKSGWLCTHPDPVIHRGGGGHGSPPLDASGQLGRGGNTQPGPVGGPLQGKFAVQVGAGRGA